jgi:hypothetical protein
MQEFHNVNFPPTVNFSVIKPTRKKWVRHAAGMGKMRKAYTGLVGKRKAIISSLGKYRRRLEHNIKMDIKDTRWEDTDRIHVSQDTKQWRNY